MNQDTNIQMVTALVLQLIQCVVVLHQPKEDTTENNGESDDDYEYDFDDDDHKATPEVLLLLDYTQFLCLMQNWKVQNKNIN